MIFEDPRRRRWKMTLLIGGLLVVAVALAAGLSALGLFVPPPLSAPFAKRPIVSSTKLRAEIEEAKKVKLSRRQLARMVRIRRQERRRRSPIVKGHGLAAAPLLPDTLVAFTIGDDPNAVVSLEQHIRQIDVLVPDWFELPGASCDLVEHIDETTQQIVARTGVTVIPRLANLAGGKWRGSETARLLRDDEARACLVSKLVTRLESIHAGGVNIDIEELRPEDSEPLLELLVELRAALHARSMRHQRSCGRCSSSAFAGRTAPTSASGSIVGLFCGAAWAGLGCPTCCSFRSSFRRYRRSGTS